MLGTIIIREIQEYLKSAKFLIGLLITVVLVTVSTFISLNDYKQRHADYMAAVEETEDDITYVRVYRAPEVLSVLVQGKDRRVGNQVDMNTSLLPYGASGYMGWYRSQHNRIMAGFEAVDFAFVVRVVLSLLVIFLAYNAVSEEKSNGTLKLALANSLPRDRLLLGKFIGGGIIVLASLLISTLIALLIMIADPEIALSSSDWIRVLGFFTVSSLYLAGFYTLSLFVSVLVNRPATSLIVLLQVWVILIIIYPNLGLVLAQKLQKLPGQEEITRQKEAAWAPYEKESKEISNAFNNAFKNGGRPSKELSLRNKEIMSKRTELQYQVDLKCGNLFTGQAQLARRISIFSPAVLYDAMMNRLARTGMNQVEKFLEAVPRHWRKHVERGKLLWKDREAFMKSKLPEFGYGRETLAESFKGIIYYAMILFLFDVVFFSLAYNGFLRKDVR